ncbi:MAG: hypothetical protein Q7U18_05820, partial [Methylobacter sp.]|nr:hypothetical protein [Methylobacter sp.]
MDWEKMQLNLLNYRLIFEFNTKLLFDLVDIHPQLKQGDSLVQPSMPEGDDSENRLTSHHLSYPDGRRYAATAHPTE